MRRALMIAILGCAACQGPIGPAGPAGADGDPAERKIFRSFHTIQRENDSGLLPDRTLTFAKAEADTWVRLSYYDSFRAYGGSGAPPCSCRWELLLDGASCSEEGKIFGEVVSVVTEQARTATIVGWCKATSAGPLGAGDHTVSVQISTPLGTCDCMTGFNRVTAVVEAEELD